MILPPQIVNGASERASKWNKEHPERRKTILQDYYRKTKEYILSQQRGYYETLKWEVFIHYSENGYPACSCCGEERLPCLSIDHVNNDGAERNRSSRGGVHFYRWLKANDFPDGFQVLCMNCQFLKEHERRTGEHYV